MMADIITHEIVVAYSQCPLKALLLLRSEDHGTPHDYQRLLEEYTRHNRIKYRKTFVDKHVGAPLGNDVSIMFGEDVFVNNTPLKFRDLETDSCALSNIGHGTSQSNFSYTPTIIVGTHQVTNEQKLSLLFAGYVLGKLQKQPPLAGTIVGANGQSHKVSLESADRTLKPIVDTLREWIKEAPTPPPQIILTKYCSLCQFRMGCLAQAEKDDNLSL